MEKNSMTSGFYCDKCGLCCEHLPQIELYADLDDGSGMCKFFDKDTRLCTIYEIRPVKCNVERAYEWFRCTMSYDEYIQKNLEACIRLKEFYQKK